MAILKHIASNTAKYNPIPYSLVLALISKVTLQRTGICIGHRHVTGLHRNQLLVCFKVVIFRQNTCTDQFFLQNLYEVQQIFRVLVADVIQIAVTIYTQACLRTSLFCFLLYQLSLWWVKYRAQPEAIST